MSCPNATAPINISIQNVTNTCDYKCAYSFSYHNSSCVATNRGDYVALSYDNASASSVSYNSLSYNVQEARIYTPSLHSYSGSKTDGELIIVHISATGGKPLLVSIPIKISNTNSISSQLFKQIVDTMKNLAHANGQSTTVTLDQYNFNTLVPKKPFYSYSATEPYQPCVTNVDYVVFDPMTATLDITVDTLNNLHSIISDNSYDIKTGPFLFYNEKGAKYGTSTGDQIYIDCTPLSATDNDMVEVITQTGSTMSFSDITNSPYFYPFIIVLIFVLLLVGTSKLTSIFRGTIVGGSMKHPLTSASVMGKTS
jgi:carbonic anhydrase